MIPCRVSISINSVGTVCNRTEPQRREKVLKLEKDAKAAKLQASTSH
jgi:hypothetical protein